MLVCSNVSPDAIDDDDARRRAAARAGRPRRRRAACGSPTRRSPGAATSASTTTRGGSSKPPTIRRSAPAWTRFHILSRGTDLGAIDAIPGDKLFFLQLADAPHLTHGRPAVEPPLPLLPRPGRVRPRRLRSRACSPPATPARSRSRSSTTSSARPTPTARRSTPCARCSCSRTRRCRRARALDGFAFVEIGVDADSAPETEALLRALGFAHVGPHRTKPVQLWRARRHPRRAQPRRAARTTPRSWRVAVESADPRRVGRARRGAARAGARAPPQPRRGRPRRGRRARRHAVFFCGADARWLDDFVALEPEPANGRADRPDRPHHARPAVRGLRRGRALLPLACSTCSRGASAELAAPDGLVRSRALASGDGRVRIALNVPALAGTQRGQAELQHVAFACARRARRRARDARARRAARCRSPRTTTTTSTRARARPRAARRAARARRPLRPQRATASSCTSTPRRRGPRVLRGARAARRLRRLRRRQLAGPHGRPANDHEEERCSTRRSSKLSRSSGRFTRAASEERELPEAPPLRRLIGPSVILVGVGIASGEYILFPYIASQAGLVFLWAAVVGVARAVLHQHGDRALHARHRRDRDRRLQRHVEAVGRRSSRAARSSPPCGRAGRRRPPPSPRSRFGGGDPNVIAIAGLLAIGVTLTASPVVYQTVEKLQFIKVGAVLVLLVVAPLRRDQRDAYRGHERDRHELRHVPERDPDRDPRRRARRGRRGRREQPRPEQLDPRQGLRHGPLRAAHRLPDHRPGGGGAGRRAPQLPDRTTPTWAAGGRGGSARTLEQFVSFALIGGDRDHRLLADRVLDRLRATRTCPTRAASTSSRSRPTCSTTRSASGSARCSWPSARSACSPPRWASSTTSRAWSPTSSTWAGRATSGTHGARAGCTSRSSGRWSCSAARSCCSGFDQPLVLITISTVLGGAIMFVYTCLLLVTNRRYLPAAVQLRGYRVRDPRVRRRDAGGDDRDRRGRPGQDPVLTRRSQSVRCSASVSSRQRSSSGSQT